VSYCYSLFDRVGGTVDAKTVCHYLLAALPFYSSKRIEVYEAVLNLTNLSLIKS